VIVKQSHQTRITTHPDLAAHILWRCRIVRLVHFHMTVVMDTALSFVKEGGPFTREHLKARLPCVACVYRDVGTSDSSRMHHRSVVLARSGHIHPGCKELARLVPGVVMLMALLDRSGCVGEGEICTGTTARGSHPSRFEKRPCALSSPPPRATTSAGWRLLDPG